MAGKRLLSLDVMRGITIVGMIVVNNAGGPLSYGSLRHSAWNGLTPCDLVFPFFLFIMGVTTYLSMSKAGFRPSAPLVGKILKRSILIILVGWALQWFGMVCKGNPWDFAHLRLSGVLPRIGLCFGIVSLMSVFMSRRAMAWTAVALLAVYTVLVCAFNGYACDASNFNAVFDRLVLGEGHIYHKSPVDPEGLAGTISAVAHTIIGFCCGAIVKSERPMAERTTALFAVGFALMASGFLLVEWMPLNKRIWSPTYVLVTTGLAAMLLAALIYVIDMRGRRRWSVFFESFGVNPLFLYVLSEILAVLMGRFGNKPAVYEVLLSLTGNPYVASAVYAVAFMLIVGAVGWPLYRRKIYIKL